MVLRQISFSKWSGAARRPGTIQLFPRNLKNDLMIGTTNESLQADCGFGICVTGWEYAGVPVTPIVPDRVLAIDTIE